MTDLARRIGLAGTCLLLSHAALAQPVQEEPPAPLQVAHFSMTSGAGRTELFEDGYASPATTFLALSRLRIGAVAGRSLGPSFTLEGGGTWQRPRALRCFEEPCDEPEPEAGTRFLGLLAARVGYEGRNVAIEGGFGVFRCPGCRLEAGSGQNPQEPGEEGPDNTRFVLSLGARLGPPAINLWAEYGAGGISGIGAPRAGFGQRTPAAIGIGHMNRYFEARVGGTSYGWVASLDVPVFDGIRVGGVAWGHEDQWAGGIRMTIPLGAGQRVGRPYRPGAR